MVIAAESSRRTSFLRNSLRQQVGPITGLFCQRSPSPLTRPKRRGSSTGHSRRYAALFAVTNANLMALARLNGSQAVAGSQPRPRGNCRHRRGTAGRCVELGSGGGAHRAADALAWRGVGHSGGVWCPLSVPVSPTGVLAWLGVTSVVSFTASLIPARPASRLTVREALVQP